MESSIDTFRLGYVARPATDHERLRESISIPYLVDRPTDSGEVSRAVSLRFRYLMPTRNKYDALKGTKAHLFNVQASDSKDVWLCEGEFDAIILNQLGFPTVGVPGASSFNTSWKFLFAGADSVTLVFDGDDAGEKGANRLASILGEVVPTVRRALLPPGLDVTDLYLQDEGALKKLVV